MIFVDCKAHPLTEPPPSTSHNHPTERKNFKDLKEQANDTTAKENSAMKTQSTQCAMLVQFSFNEMLGLQCRSPFFSHS